MVKNLRNKIISFSIASVLSISAIVPTIPVTNGEETALIGGAKAQSFNSSVDTVNVKEYRVVKEIPESKALDLLENVEATAVIGEKSTQSETPTQNPTDTLLGGIIQFLRVYEDGIKNLTAYLSPVEENISELILEYDDNQGGHHLAYTGIYYDESTRLLYGKDGMGCFAIGFDFDAEQLMFFTPVNSWQREFGFCKLYDIVADAIGMKYDTVRTKFKYDDKDWLVQIWKGNYFISPGAEIGIYVKPSSRPVEFYDCVSDDQMLQMGERLYKGDTLLFEREASEHWWVSGFSLKELCTPASKLKIEGEIVFPNEEMFKAFMDSFKVQAQAYEIEYSTTGLVVSFAWD